MANAICYRWKIKFKQMKIKLLAIGKTDDKNLQTLIEAYQNRLKHYINFEIEVIADIKNAKNLTEAQQKEKEGELILKNEPYHHE